MFCTMTGLFVLCNLLRPAAEEAAAVALNASPLLPHARTNTHKHKHMHFYVHFLHIHMFVCMKLTLLSALAVNKYK